MLPFSSSSAIRCNGLVRQAAIMRGWMSDERVMIACCSDGTRPVIFKIERMDYKAVYIEGITDIDFQNKVKDTVMQIEAVAGKLKQNLPGNSGQKPS